MTWAAALNSAGVPAESELRKAERVFYPEHIKGIPTDPSSASLPSPVLKQVPSVQDLPVDVGTSAGVSMGKEIPLLASDTPFEDALTVRDVISQAKVAEKPKDGGFDQDYHYQRGSPSKEKVVVGFYFPCFVFQTL